MHSVYTKLNFNIESKMYANQVNPLKLVLTCIYGKCEKGNYLRTNKGYCILFKD